DAVPAGRKMVIGMMLLADRHDVISHSLPIAMVLMLISSLMAILIAMVESRNQQPPQGRW
ncbi:hypothetical protein ACK3Z8_20305, partial [Aeromonas caviae]